MQCQICKSNEIRPYKVVDSVPVYLCENCRAAFIGPATRRKKTSHIYSFGDYQKREIRFRKRFEETVRLIKKYINGKKVLEVGAGFGLLSNMLSIEGFDVDVLEPDVEPIYLKGLSARVFKTYLEDYVKKTKTRYDAIILYDVLEHVDLPKETIKLFEKLLNDKGLVIIQTPNYRSLMANIVHNWSWWMVEDHRYFFSKKSLTLLFSKKIWKELYFITYEDWIDFKKNLDGNFHNRIHKAFFFGWFIPLYFAVKKLLWKLGYGGLHLAIWQYNRG